MNDDDDTKAPVPADEAPTTTTPAGQDTDAPPPSPPVAPPAPPRPTWRDRAYGIRSVAAVALAGVILGAGAGTGITLLADDDHDARDPGQFQRMGGPGDDRGRFGPGGFGPGSNQLPPGEAPQQQDEEGASQGSTQGSVDPTT